MSNTHIDSIDFHIIEKAMTRSDTAKQAKIDKHDSDTRVITESHASTGEDWSSVFHNWKHGCCDRVCNQLIFHEQRSFDDELRQIMITKNPCTCCIAQLFRKEGIENPSNVACRICFILQPNQ